MGGTRCARSTHSPLRIDVRTQKPQVTSKKSVSTCQLSERKWHTNRFQKDGKKFTQVVCMFACQSLVLLKGHIDRRSLHKSPVKLSVKKYEERSAKKVRIMKESKIVSCLLSGKIVTASHLERKQISQLCPQWLHKISFCLCLLLITIPIVYFCPVLKCFNLYWCLI